MTMPWGKYRGWPIEDVPTGYLVWCLEESNIAEPHRTAIREELMDRLDLEIPSAAPYTVLGLPPGELAPAFRDMLVAGYRALALKAHPDRGGDTETMQTVNRVRDWCRAQGLL